MSLELCVLASGSGGNCTVVRTLSGVLLIDAGIGPRTAAARLIGTGVRIRDVAAICLTHLDRDHFSPHWLGTIQSQGIGVFCHASRVQDLIDICGDEIQPHVIGFEDQFEPLPGVSMQTISLAHDNDGSHGFVIDCDGCRIGYATDLGRVTRELVDHFVGMNLLAIESNYDLQMQQDSPRPWFLKQRIIGGRGHLSNDQAFVAVKEILDRSQHAGTRLPDHIVLLHRSRQCNCPNLLRNLFSRDVRISPRLTLAEQFQRTNWLRSRSSPPLVGEQLMMAWG